MGDQGWGWMCWLLSPSLSHPRATPAVVFPSHLQPGPPLGFSPSLWHNPKPNPFSVWNDWVCPSGVKCVMDTQLKQSNEWELLLLHLVDSGFAQWEQQA